MPFKSSYQKVVCILPIIKVNCTIRLFHLLLFYHPIDIWLMVKIITLLRCIFGAKQGNGTWRIRYKYELYEIFNEPNIVNYIKVKRLAWAGHLVRMNDDRTLKKIFNTKPDGARSAGRPKLRWEDGVDQD